MVKGWEMQTVTKLVERSFDTKRMTVPQGLKPKDILSDNIETLDFMTFISSQHPLINVWLVFSLVSIGILSVLLYLI